MKKLQSILWVCVLHCLPLGLWAQNLPAEMQISDDGHMLLTGKEEPSGLYFDGEIKSIYLDFSQSNYWQLLTQNYNSHTDIAADLTVDGVTYPNVGVRFKGQTSYAMVNGQKKSFNITLDYTDPNQNLMGYTTLNLNNCFQDASFLREFLYLRTIRQYIPAAQAAFVRLYINGQDWGLYPNIQQLDGKYTREWFLSNDGSRWRADSPNGQGGPGGPGGPGGGPNWGDGTAALNYLGSDTSDYQEYYTLKNSGKTNPWDALVQVCDLIDNTPLSDLESVLANYLDIDRTLWFLATEIIFGDDDSYVYKGKMDYYIYQDAETNRFTPLEYDGNSAMVSESANWGVFYHADNANFPLLNRLLSVPSIRQRYLAHFRTILQQQFNPSAMHPLIDNYVAMIQNDVQSDPKKLYTYNQFNNEVAYLKNYITQRYNLLNGNSEVSQPRPIIEQVTYQSDGHTWQSPTNNLPVQVQANVSAPTTGIYGVNLHYATDVVGNFLPVAMYDDGNHNDNAANDGVYGATIPGLAAGTAVRFYVEAIANNPAQTRSYMPEGAEHDVYFYRVQPAVAAATDVVINEIMASNIAAVADEYGEYDDWIELYNPTSTAVNLSGYTLTDNPANLTKWQLPDGTWLAPNEYLIVWADEDSIQGPLHANFKLSSLGETLQLLNTSGEQVDYLAFNSQPADMGYARIPNGTGGFVNQAPTFAANNEGNVSTSSPDNHGVGISLMPNPSGKNMVSVQCLFATPSNAAKLVVFNALGQKMLELPALAQQWIDVSQWAAGVYYVQYDRYTAKLMVTP